MFYYRADDDHRPTRELPSFETVDDLGRYLDGEAEMLAELAAEARNERFFEERGGDDGFEEWERSQGLLSQSEMWDLVSPGTRPGYGS